MKRMIVKYVLSEPEKTFDAYPGKVVHVREQDGNPTLWVETELNETTPSSRPRGAPSAPFRRAPHSRAMPSTSAPW